MFPASLTYDTSLTAASAALKPSIINYIIGNNGSTFGAIHHTMKILTFQVTLLTTGLGVFIAIRVVFYVEQV